LKLCFKTVELTFLTSWLPEGFPGEIIWIFKICRRLLSITSPWTLTYFIFHKGFMDWLIRKNIWGLCFQFSWFPVWDIFFWHLLWPSGDEFKETERGFPHNEIIYKKNYCILHSWYGLRITSEVWKPIFHNFTSWKAGN